ncbi:hypothetical protein G9A89_010355 [Geosiphon pyriformis]|nr:hypothetical protein G9A89_010355 [Geosiphon pyriformis]
MTSDLLDDSGLAKHMAFLKHFMELLLDQVSEILGKLSFVKLVLMFSPSCVSSPFVALLLDLALNSDMAVDNVVMSSSSFLLVVNNATSKLSLSSSKVFTAKVDGLESKIMTLEVSIGSVLARLDSLYFGLVWKIATCKVQGINNLAKQKDIVHLWIANRFNSICVFTSGMNFGNLNSGVAIIMDISLAHHVCKISKVSGQLLSVRLLFKNKLSILIIGLYAGVSLVVWFSQAGEINSMIANAVNKFSFVVLDSNFNEDGSRKYASFKKYLDLGLVNSLSGSFFVKMPTWANFHGVAKMIDFLFISLNLVNTIMNCIVCNIGEFFDTDYQAVSVSVNLGGLLNMQLNSLHRQANRNW